MDGRDPVSALWPGCAGPGGLAGSAAARAGLFQALQKCQQIMDLVRLQDKCRHRWVAGIDAFGERFSERVDRIAMMQGPERWRDLERAFRQPIDGMTSG